MAKRYYTKKQEGSSAVPLMVTTAVAGGLYALLMEKKPAEFSRLINRSDLSITAFVDEGKIRVKKLGEEDCQVVTIEDLVKNKSSIGKVNLLLAADAIASDLAIAAQIVSIFGQEAISEKIIPIYRGEKIILETSLDTYNAIASDAMMDLDTIPNIVNPDESFAILVDYDKGNPDWFYIYTSAGKRKYAVDNSFLINLMHFMYINSFNITLALHYIGDTSSASSKANEIAVAMRNIVSKYANQSISNKMSVIAWATDAGKNYFEQVLKEVNL